MGNRAHYILIEDGQIHIFYSHSGALTIPAVIACGPEATLAYIRELEPTKGLLEKVWIEGAILLDVDTHHALFWGGDSIAVHPYLRRPLLAALPFLWQGWSIDWATFGMTDLVRGIGGQFSEVLEDEFDDTDFLMGDDAIATEAQLLESLKTSGPGTLLTIRWKTGEVKDYFFFVHIRWLRDEHGKPLFSAAPYEVLSLGPQLLTMMHAHPTASLPREGSEQEPDEGAFVDEETQTIRVWHNETLDPRYLEALARRWPGWQVHGHVEGMVRQIILSGRDASAVKIPDQQAINELIEEVIQQPGIDLRRLSWAIQQTLPAWSIRSTDAK